MGRVNYMDAPVTWWIVEIKTKRGATKQWQAITRFKVQTGTDEAGEPKYAERRKSKLFPPSRFSPKMKPKANATRFRNALNEWKAELSDRQDAIIERAEQARLEEERRRLEEERARIARESMSLAERMTVPEYASDFIDTLEAAQSVERSTLKSYRGCAKHIAAAMVRELQEAGATLKDAEFGALYVIGGIDGRFSSPTRIERDFKGISDAMGLVGSRGRHMTMHGLRDSFATNAIAAGADVRSVAGMLGHSNPSITLSVYSDALPEAKRRTSELLLAAVTSQGRAQEPFAIDVLPDGTPVLA